MIAFLNTPVFQKTKADVFFLLSLTSKLLLCFVVVS